MEQIFIEINQNHIMTHNQKLVLELKTFSCQYWFETGTILLNVNEGEFRQSLDVKLDVEDRLAIGLTLADKKMIADVEVFMDTSLVYKIDNPDDFPHESFHFGFEGIREFSYGFDYEPRGEYTAETDHVEMKFTFKQITGEDSE
ncbi:hypothetical protein SHAb15599_00048 [Acinetobacter phage SH-Ab 15599]|nr:hypothetical protein SHAb15599_00048 [Acinetobacter phage SH-Ab 15599]